MEHYTILHSFSTTMDTDPYYSMLPLNSTVGLTTDDATSGSGSATNIPVITSHHLTNFSDHYSGVSVSTGDYFSNSTGLHAARSTQLIDHIINDIVIPTVFAFGIVGNSVNLAVFNQKCLNHNVGVIERSATSGLITLALSDLLFCMVGVPTLLLGNIPSGHSVRWLAVVAFYYETYKVPLLNIFLLSSTWLIMLISAERCMAICYPYLARDVITVKRTFLVHYAAFIVSLCLNLPQFYAYKINRVPCQPSAYCYIIRASWFFYQQTHAGVYFVIWSILGTFLPLAGLIFCNSSILKSIYRRRGASSNSHPESQQIMMKTTWILITMVFCFIICVCPSICLQFLFRVRLASNDEHYAVANMMANLLQAIKFSGNFLLYCLVHKRFREAMRAMRCSGQNMLRGYIATRNTADA